MNHWVIIVDRDEDYWYLILVEGAGWLYRANRRYNPDAHWRIGEEVFYRRISGPHEVVK